MSKLTMQEAVDTLLGPAVKIVVEKKHRIDYKATKAPNFGSKKKPKKP